ncbi:GNAT family N-acetyltransferase [Paenibacillus whitsoniae]|uniref:GNAT family N-acetyltransferase n=1 Tax=Paenibacillus whitsoniae TaxID=2496558 RepID=A0A430J6P4_9BACL|nr:GNAT family N-acetyltransferase [Paenibacillus whitsoniae]RTE04414.1 GNAT family N-acetyltransferase [Paenibacillus whitsoniae]
MRYEPLTALHIGEIKMMWNEVWGDRFPMRERILEQNMLEDPNLLRSGAWAARDEATGQLAGYVAAKMWQDDVAEVSYSASLGWIHMLLVAPAYRERGVGSRLLLMAEKALREQGVKEIQLGKDLHRRVFPGVPEPDLETVAWLERRGYTRESHVVDLYRYFQEDLAAFPEVEGVSFRMLQDEEASTFNRFMQRCFPQWLYQTLAYWQQGGSGREFVVAEKDGEIIGFCRINDAQVPLLAQNVYWAPLFPGELGGIGPLGIDETYRGHGYGLAIVQAAVHYLHARGIRHMVIDTTPYVDFYGKLGFKTWRSYVAFCKRERI